MLNFITKEDILDAIDKDIIHRKINTTPRNGNSISLRPIVYNCIREIYYEIFDYKRIPAEDLSADRNMYWTGPLGSIIHEKIQDLTGLSERPFTEKLMTFKTFNPLMIRSKCDGIDDRDPDNAILYEIKTKNSIPSKPYEEELLQNLLSCLLFRRECKINIKGSSMVYILRDNPYEIRFFNYDFFDVTSPLYLNVNEKLKNTMDKLQELIACMNTRIPPSMNSKFIKTSAFGKSRCKTCVYRDQCKSDS